LGRYREEGDVVEVLVYVGQAGPREGSEREAEVEYEGDESWAPYADDDAPGKETEEAGSGEHNLFGTEISIVEEIEHGFPCES